jgi:hypothetical protein
MVSQVWIPVTLGSMGVTRIQSQVTGDWSVVSRVWIEVGPIWMSVDTSKM